MVSTATPGDGVARASKFAVSKVSTGSGGGETRGSSKRHGLGYTFVKCSSLAVAKTLILLGDDGAAPIDHAGAGRVDGASRGVTLHSRWRRPRRCRCGFVPGRASRKCPAPTPWHAWTAGAAALRAGRRRAPLYAIDATRHKFRQQPELRLAWPRCAAPRDRFASACASSSLGPWSDDPSASVGGRDRTISAARIRSGSTPGSCTRAFPYSPA